MVYYHPKEIYKKIIEAGRLRPSVIIMRNLVDPTYLINLINQSNHVPQNLRDKSFDKTLLNLEAILKAKEKVFEKKVR